MPRTSIVFYQEADGTAPVAAWLAQLRRTTPRAYAKCAVRVNYRLLYSFHGRAIALLLHALTKEDVVSDRDIDLAVARKRAFEQPPDARTFVPPE